MKTIEVESSRGTLIIDTETGEIQSNLFYDVDPNVTITKFDVKEWHEAYPGRKLHSFRSIDILDLGYWYTHKGIQGYEPPDESWRKEFRRTFVSNTMHVPYINVNILIQLPRELYDRLNAVRKQQDPVPSMDAIILMAIGRAVTQAEMDLGFLKCKTSKTS